MASRPNFLLIITDQHRADHLGSYGNTIVHTPNIDGIAARGWSADRFYVTCAICMPNRATLMTGRMTSLHGVRHNGIALSLRATTFVDLLRAAGYATGMSGKSHLQNMTGRGPVMEKKEYPGALPPPPELAEAIKAYEGDDYEQERSQTWRDDPSHDLKYPYYGFDRVELAIEHSDRVHGHYTRWLREHDPRGDNLRGPDNALPSDGWTAPQVWRTAIPEELYPTSFVAEKAKEMLADYAKEPDKPFFLKVSFPDPHHPFTPPGHYFDMYDPADVVLPESFKPADNNSPPHKAFLHAQRDAGKAFKTEQAVFACTEREAREATALTYGSITMIDDAIGGILAELEIQGLADNTIVIFTSDHADYMGDHQLMLKGPLHYHGLIRVPFLWHDPASPADGGRSAGMCGTIDIGATVLDRAGIAPFNGMQGRSMLPLIGGDDSAGYETFLLEEESQNPCPGTNVRAQLRTLLDGRYRISLYAGVEWGELYDLENDPHEMENLWFDPGHQAKRAELIELMARKMLDLTDTSPFPTARA